MNCPLCLRTLVELRATEAFPRVYYCPNCKKPSTLVLPGQKGTLGGLTLLEPQEARRKQLVDRSENVSLPSMLKVGGEEYYLVQGDDGCCDLCGSPFLNAPVYEGLTSYASICVSCAYEHRYSSPEEVRHAFARVTCEVCGEPRPLMLVDAHQVDGHQVCELCFMDHTYCQMCYQCTEEQELQKAPSGKMLCPKCWNAEAH
jgi:hypothetical protein